MAIRPCSAHFRGGKPARKKIRHCYYQYGAGNGTRTRDPKLGRLALYQLSYSREIGGEGRIRTFEGIAGRFTVCSLWPLGNLSTTPPINTFIATPTLTR